MILRNIDLTNNHIIKGNCFDYNIIVSKTAINPPYGMRDKKELDFVLKQIASTIENGLICAVIPTTSINNNKFLNHKKEILKYSTPKCIINLNKNVFYPFASVQCSIILLQKAPYNNEPVLFINYENDGYSVEKHRGRIQEAEFGNIFLKILQLVRNPCSSEISLLTPIKYDSDWNFHAFNQIIDFRIKYQEINDKLLSVYLATQKLIPLENYIKIDKTKNFYLYEIFDIQTVKRITLKSAKENKGNVPYISASALNNGITAYTNRITHRKYCLTIANSGSVGSCFYHQYDICATDSVYVLRLRKHYQYLESETNLMCFLAVLIEKNKIKYNFGRACRINKIIGDFIPLKTDDRGFADLQYYI